MIANTAQDLITTFLLTGVAGAAQKHWQCIRPCLELTLCCQVYFQCYFHIQ
jgi:hypothetical protein